MSNLVGFVGKRALLAVPILWAIVTIVFVFLRLSGDPVALFVSPANATDEEIARVRALLGLDRPIHVQYLQFIGRAARADFGESLMFREDGMGVVLSRLPNTLYLAMSSTLLALVLGIAAGICAAVYGRWVDQFVSILAVLGQTMPSFWLGLVMILVFATQLRWFPATGAGTVAHLVLPSLTLGFYMTARTSRLMRSSMLDVLGQDFIRTARSKGLSRTVVIMGHALRNAILPVITISAVTFAVLIGNAVVVEEVFAWPGIGRLLVEGVFARDYPLVQATIFTIALVILATNILLDLIYGLVDPRIQVA